MHNATTHRHRSFSGVVMHRPPFHNPRSINNGSRGTGFRYFCVHMLMPAKEWEGNKFPSRKLGFHVRQAQQASPLYILFSNTQQPSATIRIISSTCLFPLSLASVASYAYPVPRCNILPSAYPFTYQRYVQYPR